MKKEKADKMIDQLKWIIRCHNNWVSEQKYLKRAAEQFDKSVENLCKMINEEVKDE